MTLEGVAEVSDDHPTGTCSRVSRLAGQPAFSEAERAALALTEAGTRLPRPRGRHPGVDLDRRGRTLPRAELATLVMGIATVNLWNRVNVITAQH